MSRRKRMPSYRIWGSIEDGDIEFESLTTETLEGALEVIRESFFKYEAVCNAVELLSEPGAAKELEELCLIAAQDGVSVVAIEVATGKVVAVSFNKIQILPAAGSRSSFEEFTDTCKYESSKSLVQFMLNVDTRLNIFEHHNVDKILEIMFIATLQTHCKKRVGELLVAASIEIARQLRAGNDVKTPVEINGIEIITNKDVVPELCSAICTSDFSYKLFHKLGFDTLLTISYDEFLFRGKKYSERHNREEYKSCKLVTKRLSPISLPR